MSKRFPQFDKQNLKNKLHKYHIKYIHIRELGGRRYYKNIHHPAIKLQAFSSYAEYMMGNDFAHGLSELKKIARACRTAYMCSETLWWKCHRRMISDRL